MTMQPHDMTPLVDLTHEKGTGPARSHQPSYVSLLPPCNNACPAGEDIQAWLAHAQAGRFQKAWLKLVEDSPLPAVQLDGLPCLGDWPELVLPEQSRLRQVLHE